jgi:hypothetical protein
VIDPRIELGTTVRYKQCSVLDWGFGGYGTIRDATDAAIELEVAACARDPIPCCAGAFRSDFSRSRLILSVRAPLSETHVTKFHSSRCLNR